MYTETGKHLIMDIWMEDFDEDIFVYIAQGLTAHKYKIISVNGKHFDGGGETSFWLLEESHCSLHTYPEHHYASIDLYTCDDNKNVIDFEKFIVNKLKDNIKLIKTLTIRRGNIESNEFSTINTVYSKNLNKISEICSY